jgi:hypothetical protein
MYQTGYTGILPLQRNFTYVGGFCRFWYIPFEDIGVFPRINPDNQKLVAEPSLKVDKAWFGPIKVPRDKLGYNEELKYTKAGPYYECKVEGMHIGDSPESRVNFENMPYHKYVIIGKMRAGGMYLLIGTVDSPCTFNTVFNSGKSGADTSQTAIQFITEHISKAYIIPSFNGDTLSPGIGGDGPGEEIMANQKEIIPFVGQSSINIPWTPLRLSKFGTYPVIDVYMQEGDEKPVRVPGGSVEADAAPPAFTELTVNLGGDTTGFIVIT